MVGGRVTEAGRLGAFITVVKKGSLADIVGHLRAGMQSVCVYIQYVRVNTFVCVGFEE